MLCAFIWCSYACGSCSMHPCNACVIQAGKSILLHVCIAFVACLRGISIIIAWSICNGRPVSSAGAYVPGDQYPSRLLKKNLYRSYGHILRVDWGGQSVTCGHSFSRMYTTFRNKSRPRSWLIPSFIVTTLDHTLVRSILGFYTIRAHDIEYYAHVIEAYAWSMRGSSVCMFYAWF